MPCRGANPPVAQPAHAHSVPSPAAELEHERVVSPDEGLARRQAPDAETRVARRRR